ncbi:MAG TPA: hypothetical protein VI524_01200, partial [Anaerolineales bacterium]|nr:hypothetical protein [Anaerolineales bacterium]
MLQFGKPRGTLLRLILLIGVVIAPLISIQAKVFAQGNRASLWVVRSLHVSEYGIDEPKGLAFSPSANAFLLLDGSPNITLVTMNEDRAGTWILPELPGNPLNVAFDQRTSSLFVLDSSKSELVKSKADGIGFPSGSIPSIRFSVQALGIGDPQGLAFDPETGSLFILDSGNAQIIAVAPQHSSGFDVSEAIHANEVKRISLKELGGGGLSGLGFNPGNGNLYVSRPAQKELYELTPNGDLVSSFDLEPIGIDHPAALVFAPSVDATDDPNIHDLFILDAENTGQTAKAGTDARVVSVEQVKTFDNQIVELSLQAPAALPAGVTLLPTTLIRTIDTSNAAWNPSSPDPSGIDYWPPTGKLLISDSEVEEMTYWTGKNVYQSTTSGTLISTCTTFTANPTTLAYNNFSSEPSGLAVNPGNNHIFFSDDNGNDRIFEVSLGTDGTYCTSDDTVTSTDVFTLYGIADAEDVAYGNNTLFVAGGVDAEVYRIPLGGDGVLGSGDVAAMTSFDTFPLGFSDLEGIGYNQDNGTLFIVSTQSNDRYLGEITTGGALVRAYDLSLMGSAGNIRSDVVYAPGSQNPALKNIYIASRGVDNDTNPIENDGRVWEINLLTPTVVSVVRAGGNPTSAASVIYT